MNGQTIADVESPSLVALDDTFSDEAVSLSDFWADMRSYRYIFEPTGDTWPASSVDARLAPVPVAGDKPIPASKWIAANRAVEQITWDPGSLRIIKDRLTLEGGWIDHPGAAVFNLYRAPTIQLGDPAKAQPWIDHVFKVYPDEGEHIIKWLAHRRQRPGEKVNHAIVLGGDMGVGKDSIVEPVKRAVGNWNCSEVTPKQVLGRFNSFVRSVILRINEARDLGDFDRFAFYDHSKNLIAAPPDMLRVDEKNLREYHVPNVCGVIITTNHKTDGLHLPAGDRRHYVAWSPRTKEEFPEGYFQTLYRWYDNGGDGHVAAHLDRLDLSGFNPKAPPPLTPAFWEIVDAARAPEDAELSDLLDRLGNPNAVPTSRLMSAADEGFRLWLTDRKNRRAIGHKMNDSGYTTIRNADAKDGLWRVNNKREVIYAKKELSVSERLRAASRVTGGVDWSEARQ
jgi:hypothetical protein